MTTKEAALILSYGLLITIHPFDIRAQQVPLPTNALAGERSTGASMLPNQPTNLLPSAPHVTCQGNRLTIAAENSTLGSILSAVRACIGVEFDMPDAAATELSYVKLGPGPTREVLDELLGSTQFNYAIQSSNSEPEKISSILIMARGKAGEDSPNADMPAASEFTMTPARQTWLASVRALKASTQTDADRSRVVGAEPVTLSTPDDVRHIQAIPDSSVADTSAANSTHASKDTNTLGTQSAAVPSEAVSAASPPSPTGELQNKIGEMQQLFEQRKKMMADLGTTPVQN